MSYSQRVRPPVRKPKLAWAGLGVFAALFMSLLFTRNPTRHGAQTPVLEPRAAGPADLAREGIAADRYALVASLWGDYAVPSCRVGAVWGDNPAGASLSATLRVSMKSPLRAPAAAARATTWIAREQLDLAAANDADVAARYVRVEPGAEPVVRIFRATRFKPRRAQFDLGAGLRLAA